MTAQPCLTFAGEHATVVVDLDRGASVTSWRLADGTELMFQPSQSTAYSDVTGWYLMLPNAGPAGSVGGRELRRHGDIRLKSWRLTGTGSTDGSAWATMTVQSDDAPLFVEREVVVDDGGRFCRITDTVSNTAASPVTFVWGHHVTFDQRFADGARLDTPPGEWFADAAFQPTSSRVLPGARGPLDRMPARGGAPVDLTRYDAATTSEMLFCGPVGAGLATLLHPRLGLSVRLTWDEGVLPYLWLWQLRADGGAPGGLALEPQASDVPGITGAAAAGKAIEFAGGEARTVAVSVEIRPWGGLPERQ